MKPPKHPNQTPEHARGMQNFFEGKGWWDNPYDELVPACLWCLGYSNGREKASLNGFAARLREFAASYEPK